MENLRSMQDIYKANSFDRIIASEIYDAIGTCADICDFGAGHTELADFFVSENGKNYAGVDINQGFVQMANERFKNSTNIKFIYSSLFDFENPDYDCVVCSRLIHHFSNSSFRKCIRKMIETISFQGRIIIIDSLRDYSNRTDRFLYLPENCIYELTQNILNVSYKQEKEIMVSGNQYWMLTADIAAEVLSFKTTVIG